MNGTYIQRCEDSPCSVGCLAQINHSAHVSSIVYYTVKYTGWLNQAICITEKKKIGGLQPKLRPWHFLLIFLCIFCHLALLFLKLLSHSFPTYTSSQELYPIGI